MRYVRLSLIAFFLVLIILGSPDGIHADTATELQSQINDSNKQIADLKAEIAQLQTQLNDTTKQKQTLQSAIAALNLNIQKLQTNIILTQAQIKQKDLEIGGLTDNITDTTGKIGQSQSQVANSLRELETHDEQPLVVTLLGGGTLSSFFTIISIF